MSLAERIALVNEKIAAAARQAGREPSEVTLVAATKVQTSDTIRQAIAAGVTICGENRVQEFLGKRDALRLDGVGVHLIGHLQTNKVTQIVGLVDCIESIDSLRVARAVSDASLKIGRVTDVLVEVNIGREEAKSGVLEEELEPLLEQISSFSGIRVCGLMTVPPILETEREKRQVFSQMRQLFIDMRGKNIDNVNMSVLSMGMSSDYREAILEGATIIRVGSALFGRRNY